MSQVGGKFPPAAGRAHPAGRSHRGHHTARRGDFASYQPRPRAPGAHPEEIRNEVSLAEYALVSATRKKSYYYPLEAAGVAGPAPVAPTSNVAKRKGKAGNVVVGSEEEKAEFERQKKAIEEENRRQQAEKEAEDLQLAMQNSRVTKEAEDREEYAAMTGSSAQAAKILGGGEGKGKGKGKGSRPVRRALGVGRERGQRYLGSGWGRVRLAE